MQAIRKGAKIGCEQYEGCGPNGVTLLKQKKGVLSKGSPPEYDPDFIELNMYLPILFGSIFISNISSLTPWICPPPSPTPFLKIVQRLVHTFGPYYNVRFKCYTNVLLTSFGSTGLFPLGRNMSVKLTLSKWKTLEWLCRIIIIIIIFDQTRFFLKSISNEKLFVFILL